MRLGVARMSSDQQGTSNYNTNYSMYPYPPHVPPPPPPPPAYPYAYPDPRLINGISIHPPPNNIAPPNYYVHPQYVAQLHRRIEELETTVGRIQNSVRGIRTFIEVNQNKPGVLEALKEVEQLEEGPRSPIASSSTSRKVSASPDGVVAENSGQVDGGEDEDGRREGTPQPSTSASEDLSLEAEEERIQRQKVIRSLENEIRTTRTSNVKMAERLRVMRERVQDLRRAVRNHPYNPKNRGQL